MIRVEKIIDNKAKIGKAFRALTGLDVLVGVPAAEAPRDGSVPINNATLAYIHENGSPAANIPARPFLVPGIRKGTPLFLSYLRQAAEAALEGNPGRMRRSLEAAGQIARDAVKREINSNVPPPLSEKTLAARRRRGVTRTNTLIDTGQLRNSINYVVRPR
jgi:hypothetical protein